ncbi:MAG: N-6 DNA methylase, partial [Pseudomonadales bacterium]|nr:N-6 DNA methylase [Pseudomonadales bacterium]
MLEEAALGNADYQTEVDYQTPKGLRLKDDYSRAFQIACAQWKHFAPLLDRTDLDTFACTSNFVGELLKDTLGYSLQDLDEIVASDRKYPVTWVAGNVPIIVAPFNLGLDEIDVQFSTTSVQHSGSRKKSAFQLAQELLNASDDHLWALVTNGRQLRLMRDSASLTRPSFLEVDIEDLLEGQRFSEFANVWRMLHASRSGFQSRPEQSIWELWREAGKEAGFQVRNGLRNGVEETLKVLGEGFIQHPKNSNLLAQLDSGELTKEDYFQQLLRLVYRLIFLFTVEERGLLHPKDESKHAQHARQTYAQGYALGRLRDICLKRRARNSFDDQWQAIKIIFKGLAAGGPKLALPALGGLFAADQCPHLDTASLSNEHLLMAILNLRWANYEGNLAPVDYRNMGPEELGSVYESLLELDPQPDAIQKTFDLVSTTGNDRKTSGSYYTPDSLVQELIKSALEPVIEQRLTEHPENPIDAVLSIRVVDPACGSGHFLLAAARRLAETVAELRVADGVVKPSDYRHALREVVSHCIFGVDRNPMALELARTALWLEGFEEGRPLSFIDHHLQCGDALLGVMDLKSLEFGIPKAAFKPLSGDDKDICKALNKLNTAELKDLSKKREAKQFKQIDEFISQDNSLELLDAIEAMPGETTLQEAEKEEAYREFLIQANDSPLRHAADMLLGAFLLPKESENEQNIPTSANLYLELLREKSSIQVAKLEASQRACETARVFHWPLAFPQVFAQGGFDCVLGNPPWERIKLQEEEFFASRHPDIVSAKNKAERNRRIQWLSEGELTKNLYPDTPANDRECEAEQRLFKDFLSAKRESEAISVFVHVKGEEGGRYPFTGVGDVNTYALFSETISGITNGSGRGGFIVPSGIATDDSTKRYFQHLVNNNRLVSLIGFDNALKIFPA